MSVSLDEYVDFPRRERASETRRLTKLNSALTRLQTRIGQRTKRRKRWRSASPTIFCSAHPQGSDGKFGG